MNEQPLTGDADPGDLPPAPARPALPTLEDARRWCEDLLAEAPWEPVSDRVTALVVTPPDAEWAEARMLGAWFVLDARTVRHLARPWGDALARQGARSERQRIAGGVRALLVALTEEALAKRIEAVTRPALEARWLVEHAAPVHDPLRRHQLMVGAARRLPEGAHERALRTQFLALHGGFRSLQVGGAEPAALGETAAAAARLCCVLDRGMHPPPEWLLPAARETELGGRLESWFDDLRPAMAGDPRAGRWIVDAADGVLREAQQALHHTFGDRDWLRDPDSFAMRPPR